MAPIKRTKRSARNNQLAKAAKARVVSKKSQRASLSNPAQVSSLPEQFTAPSKKSFNRCSTRSQKAAASIKIKTSEADQTIANDCPQTEVSKGDNVCGDHLNNQDKLFTFSHLTLEDLRQMNEKFIKERNWDQFHSPRNVLLALVGEVGELSEVFQWKGEVSEGLPELTDVERQHVGEEISDVLIYLIDFASRCHIDISKAVTLKMAANAKKYPVDKAFGQANKYTDYQ